MRTPGSGSGTQFSFEASGVNRHSFLLLADAPAARIRASKRSFTRGDGARAAGASNARRALVSSKGSSKLKGADLARWRGDVFFALMACLWGAGLTQPSQRGFQLQHSAPNPRLDRA